MGQRSAASDRRDPEYSVEGTAASCAAAHWQGCRSATIAPCRRWEVGV